MVQTIATVLMTYAQRPTLDHCNVVAMCLIEEYPFLKDSTGEGQVLCCIVMKFSMEHSTVLSYDYHNLLYT